MKTRVNLFSETLLAPELRLSFLRLIRAVIATVLVLSLSAATVYGLVSAKESERDLLVEQKQRLDDEKQELEAKLAARAPDPLLVAEVDLKAQQLELKQMLLGKLSQEEALTSLGYSPLMKDLARVADRNIWLNRIRVSENRFIFEGYSASPQSVPHWIDRLKNTTTLKGHAFASMTMNRGEGQPLSFRLTSDSEDATGSADNTGGSE